MIPEGWLRPGGTLLEFSADWTPIFADPDRRYTCLKEIVSWRPCGSGAEIEANTEGASRARIRISFVTPHVFRLQAWLEEEPPESSPMLVEGARRQHPAALSEEPPALVLDSGALRVRADRRQWALAVEDASGRPIFQQRWDDRQLLGAVTLPTGFSQRAGEPPRFHETFSLEPGEHLYGLGAQFGALDKRGQRIVSWSRDPRGAATSTVSYINIPLLLSSRGFGLFIHHHSKIVYELGSPAVQSVSFLTGDPYLDYFFIHGPSLRQVIERYTELTGRPRVPPLWSFGAWYSRCMYHSRQQVEEIASRLRELRIPADVLHLDPLWLKARKGKTLDGCDFVWDEEAFPDPDGFLAWLEERGFRLSLWENPYVYRDTPMFREGQERGYFARSSQGGLAAPLENPKETVLPDFTNPEVARWWQEKHLPYLRMGVAAFKTDYGEGVPPDALFSDGRNGQQVHNLYPLLYNQAVYEAMEKAGAQPMLFARSGYAGSQRYPINWTGDAPCTWGGLAATLRAGLSLSMSGIAMWSHDIGGFWNPRNMEPPEPELYIRWAQFGLLSSHARFHGIKGREPWYYGDKAIEVVRRFSNLRYRLLPYIYSLAHEAAASGMPVVRPLVLEYQDDPAVSGIDYEYLLGPSLLCVPVLAPGGQCAVYLPEGLWYDWWTGEEHLGPKHMRLTVPIDILPIFVRDGAILPMAPEMEHTGQKAWDPLTLEVRASSSAETSCWTPDQRLTARFSESDGRFSLEVDGPEQGYEVRLLGKSIQDARVSAGAALLSLFQEDGAAVARIEGAGSWRMEGAVRPV